MSEEYEIIFITEEGRAIKNNKTGKIYHSEFEIIEEKNKEIDRLNNIISQIETLIINHNCDTGDIYYKYNGKYLKSELKERIIELVELKENK